MRRKQEVAQGAISCAAAAWNFVLSNLRPKQEAFGTESSPQEPYDAVFYREERKGRRPNFPHCVEPDATRQSTHHR
jgi:hypothetical protein